MSEDKDTKPKKYARTPEQKKDRADKDRAWREQNLEQYRAEARARYATDPEKAKARSRAYREANLDKVRAYQKRSREADPERWKRWYAKNREKVLANAKRRYSENREEMLNRTKRWYNQNRERALARSKRYTEENREEKLARRRFNYKKNHDKYLTSIKRYREANPGKASASYKKWRDSHLDIVAAFRRNGKARKRAAEGKHTAADIRAIWERQKRRCAVKNCPHPIAASGKDKYHVDHITPLAKGGSNWPDNLQILCRFHNMTKNAKDEYEWAQEQGLLFPL